MYHPRAAEKDADWLSILMMHNTVVTAECHQPLFVRNFITIFLEGGTLHVNAIIKYPHLKMYCTICSSRNSAAIDTT